MADVIQFPNCASRQHINLLRVPLGVSPERRDTHNGYSSRMASKLELLKTRRRARMQNSAGVQTSRPDWSTRAANVAQVGLLALAAFGYYYTVIPLYQKALLDEEIAQKSLQIKTQEAQIASTSLRLVTLEKVAKTAQHKVDALNAVIAADAATTRQIQEQDLFATGLHECANRGTLGMNMFAPCVKALFSRQTLRTMSEKDRATLSSIVDTTTASLRLRYEAANADKGNYEVLRKEFADSYLGCLTGRNKLKDLQMRKLLCRRLIDFPRDNDDAGYFKLGADGITTIVEELAARR